MQRRGYSITGLGLALALAVTSALGCQRRDRGEQTATARDTASSGAAGDVSAGGRASASWSDANIVALLDEANAADSAAGAAAVGKATNRKVVAFAHLMMGEHHALRVQGQQLARKLGITPQPPTSDPLAPLARGEMDALHSTSRGPQFDRTYIEQEVAAHRAVLDLLDKANAQAQHPQLKALIQNAKPVIQRHLDLAQTLHKDLGGAA